MKSIPCSRRQQSGASLIEILVTLVILMLGLLGLVGLMVQSQRSQMESYQRVQALVALEDMVNRINANRKAAASYVITESNGASFLGTASTLSPICPDPTSTQTPQERAACDLKAWHDLLVGSTETMSVNNVVSNVGGMLGARGCVQLVSAGVYQISVVWQGGNKTVVPANVSCGTGLYGKPGDPDADAQRRAVSVNLRIASLS